MSLYRKFIGSIDDKESFSLLLKVKEFFLYKKILFKEKMKNITFESVIIALAIMVAISSILFLIFGLPLTIYHINKDYQNRIEYGLKICAPNYYYGRDALFKDGKEFIRFSCFKENGETYYVLDR